MPPRISAYQEQPERTSPQAQQGTRRTIRDTVDSKRSSFKLVCLEASDGGGAKPWLQSMVAVTG